MSATINTNVPSTSSGVLDPIEELDSAASTSDTAAIYSDDTSSSLAPMYSSEEASDIAGNGIIFSPGSLIGLEGKPGSEELLGVIDIESGDYRITAEELSSLSPDALILLSSLENENGVRIYDDQITLVVSQMTTEQATAFFKNLGQAVGNMTAIVHEALDDGEIGGPEAASKSLKNLTSMFQSAQLGISLSENIPLAERDGVQQAFIQGVLEWMTGPEVKLAREIAGLPPVDINDRAKLFEGFGAEDLVALLQVKLSTDHGVGPAEWLIRGDVEGYAPIILDTYDSLTSIVASTAILDDSTLDVDKQSYGMGSDIINNMAYDEERRKASVTFLNTVGVGAALNDDWSDKLTAHENKNSAEIKNQLDVSVELMRLFTRLIESSATQ